MASSWSIDGHKRLGLGWVAALTFSIRDDTVCMTMQADDNILWTLHQQLQAIADTDPVEKDAIQQQIRAQLPVVNKGLTSGHAPRSPHKKTPKGQTTTLHMNYTRNRAGEPVDCELEHLRFFAQTAQTVGLRLEILTYGPHRQDVENMLATDLFTTLNYDIIESPQPISKWAEDSVEYLNNGDAAVLTPT